MEYLNNNHKIQFLKFFEKSSFKGYKEKIFLDISLLLGQIFWVIFKSGI